MISPIFTTIVICFLSVMIFMKVTTNRFNTGDEKRIEKERESNSVRRKSLDELEFITIPVNSLPFTSEPASGNGTDGSEEKADDVNTGDTSATADMAGSGNKTGDKADNTAPGDALSKAEQAVLLLKDKKIVNFTGVSNTDLKMTYGAPNLPLLTEYDQNFTALVKALDTWGALLVGLNRNDDARKVLEFAVECRTDLKSSYMMLADMYAEGFEFDKLDHLVSVAGSLNSLMSGPIVRALKDKSDINKYVEKKK